MSEWVELVNGDGHVIESFNVEDQAGEFCPDFNNKGELLVVQQSLYLNQQKTIDSQAEFIKELEEQLKGMDEKIPLLKDASIKEKVEFLLWVNENASL